MNDRNIQDLPEIHLALEAKSKEIGFTMPSDVKIGSLLKTLISTKPNSNFLELGTGIGLSLSWMVEGMDEASKLTSVDIDPQLIVFAQKNFGNDQRVQLICSDGAEWIKNYNGEQFDLIFADAWPGKYSEIDEILDLVKVGGFYIVDDMMTQSNWPEGHQENVDRLVNYLENRSDFYLTKLNWSSGIIIAVKNINKYD